MSHEAPAAEQSIPQPTAMLQYPEAQGVIPVAEMYGTPGTVINWEQNPHTQAPENGQDTGGTGDERRVIMGTGDGSFYYLHGNDMYVFARRPHGHELVQETRFTNQTPLPEEVTLGEPAPFTSGAAIDEVLVAAGELTVGDDRTADILSGSEVEPINHFEQFDRVITAHRMAQRAQLTEETIRQSKEEQQRQLMAEMEGASVELRDSRHTFVFRDPRMWDLSAERRDDDKDNPVKLGVEAPVQPTPDRPMVSDHGVEISPNSRGFSSHQDGDPTEYKPRFSARIEKLEAEIGEKIVRTLIHPIAETRRLRRELRGSARALMEEITEGESTISGREQLEDTIAAAAGLGGTAVNGAASLSLLKRRAKERGFKAAVAGAYYHNLIKETVSSYWEKAKNLKARAGQDEEEE